MCVYICMYIYMDIKMCLYINVDVLIPYIVCHLYKIIWTCVHVASSRTPHLRAVKPSWAMQCICLGCFLAT